MKDTDLAAIQQINTQNHLYLRVKGKGDTQRLAICKRGFLGRTWMWLGLSSSSMKKIASYIAKNADEFKTLDSDSSKTIKEKLTHFNQRHKNKKVTAALNVLNSTSTAEDISNSSALGAGVHFTDYVPPARLLTDHDEQIQDFNDKFNLSAPTQPQITGPRNAPNKDECHRVLEAERRKLNAFSQYAEVGTHDIVYLCIGAGDKTDQIWPGFVFDAVSHDKKIKTLLFEQFKLGVDQNNFYEKMAALSNEEEMGSLTPKLQDNYHVYQFSCGYPDDEDSRDQEPAYLMTGNVLWESQKHLHESKDLLEAYIRKELEQGKTIVLGEHRGLIGDMGHQTITLYNQLREEFPNQVHFLWGWGSCNLMTSKKIEEDDCQPAPPTEAWTYFASLKDCFLETKDS